MNTSGDKTISVLIKEKAQELGFDLCGIAAARPLKEREKILNNWCSDGMNAGMSYLSRDIEKRINAAREKVIRKEASPIVFFMEWRLMDMGILSSYTGFWKWTIKRHMNPAVFKKLSAKKIQQYADAFNVSVEEFKTMNVHED